jgi:signal transduction histidine kinase
LNADALVPSPARPSVEALRALQHELRSPLNAVLGLSQLLLLQRTALSPEQRDWMEKIHLAGSHMLGVVESMEQSWGSDGNRPGAETRLRSDLHRGLREAIELMKFAAALQEVSIRTEIDLEGCLVAPGNETMHRQIFVNLLSNAIKFGSPGGSVVISVRRSPSATGFVAIDVRDDGCGMAPDDLAKLFEPFQRFGRTRDERSGSGLGLHLIEDLVRRLGGTIEVTSAVGEGSTFTVCLPLIAPPTADAERVQTDLAACVCEG